ncbi:copper homeostasis membrane protein CopD [Telmatospirillum sp.]|uniref:copper homeostasis membrane protein CopD n=1 Tax=Telmatospirillum sp. TaxID=2079197 RepID=UPI0028445BEE|nr:copper homeostasis membrane protein CopD [Telmatospirillum sp.]MDR3440481.1 copper homeostasis membrane protein CopD [Telmatospirillum sp.]
MDDALVLCRLFHYGAAIFLFGASIFQWWLAPTAVARALDQPLRWGAGLAIPVVFGTALAWLALMAGGMGAGWRDTWDGDTIVAVLFDTEFGRVWQWRLICTVFFLGLLATGRHDRWPLTAVLSALLLGSLGFVGHAVMQEGGLGWVSRGSHLLHLWAAGFWLGSLVPLLILLPKLSDPALRSAAVITLRRFSRLGHFAVAIIILTGIVNTYLVLDRTSLSRPYLVILIVKICCVAAMIGLAIVNRYILVPRLGGRSNAFRLLRTATLLEVVLGIGVIGLVSALGIMAPM